MINLLPYKEKRSIEKIRTIRLVATSILGFICVVVVGVVLLIPTFITINSRFSITKKQISDLQKNSSITTDIDLVSFGKRISNIESKLSLPEKNQPTMYFDVTKSLVPSGIVINQFLTIDDNRISVSGVVDNREILQSFIKALESNEKVSSVDNPVSNFIKNKNSVFALTIAFK